jgi:NAD(P)H-dependent FMN reductase
MTKVLLICGTNRNDSLSLPVTKVYEQILVNAGAETQMINLQDLPVDFAFTALYDNQGKNYQFNRFIEAVADHDKCVFIVPEYNGSFPGILKTFIDGLPYPGAFRAKKCALVGLSSGGHNASLALSHLTDIFNFCGMNVLAYQPRLEHIEEFVKEGTITNPKYLQRLERQAKQFIEF